MKPKVGERRGGGDEARPGWPPNMRVREARRRLEEPGGGPPVWGR